MKYLLVFYFAGFFLADATLIKKYKLELEPKEDKFEGTVTLTLSDKNNNNDVKIDTYAYEVKDCTYTTQTTTTTATTTTTTTDTTTAKPTTTTTAKPTTTTTAKPKNKTGKEERGENGQGRCTVVDNKITFPEIRITEEVVVKFKGQYQGSVLSKYVTGSNDRFYVADMADESRKIIFPCQEKVKAEFELVAETVMSNLENLRKKDEENKVFLRDLAFVQGDIVRDDNSVKSLPYYRMKTSNGMSQKLKNVMEKVAELDPSLKILFTPVTEEISTVPRDVIIVSGVDLKPDDSGYDYWIITSKLAEKLFQRPKEVQETFFDHVVPKFATMKILNLNDFPFEGYRKFSQIQGLQVDGFNNSKSLNELTSTDGKPLGLSVVHAKGTSILHSLESICGNENFTRGLSNYARNGNSQVNETFEGCFGDKNKAQEFFKVWTDDPGYSVVHVTLNKTNEYHMDQERFLWFGSKQKDQRWIIQTDYKTKEGSGGNIVLPASKDKVTVTINSTYFILDHNNKGFYRVNYDAKLWEALISQLKSNHTAIDVVSRMKLIDDVFSFPKSTYNFNHGIPDYTTALKLSEYLKKETDFQALKVALDALGFLDCALNSPHHGKFRDHMKGILNEIYDKIEKVNSIIHPEVIPLACKFGVEKCIKNATHTFGEIKSNATELSDIERFAICSVVRNDSTKWVDSAVLLSEMGIDPAEKNFLLGCSRDEKILSMFLSQFIASKNRQGFIDAVTSAMSHNPDNIKVILDIIKRYEGAITRVFGNECLVEIVRLALPKLNSESAVTIKEIAKNFDEALKNEVNMICANVKQWTDTKAKSVGEYFKGSGSQAKPLALVLLVTTLLPLANHIFHS